MEEIRVGDFIRTTRGEISKITSIKYDGLACLKWYFCNNDRTCINKPYITKHSSNIIDLIEVGDYVNGWKVRDVYLEGERHYLKLTGLEHARIYDDDIKSIVTHESFNSIKYEVI